MSTTLLLALLPVILLIGLGVLLRRSGFLAEAFWPQAEHLSYFVLLPALFVHGLSSAELDGVPIVALALALVLGIVATALVLLALRPWLASDSAAFTSVFQGGIRFNNYVGVTLASGLFGAQGVALAAVANAAIVPTVNVLCVLVFARFGTARPTLHGVLRQLALNPLILACLAGIALQGTGLTLPPGLDGAVRALGQASLPLGLLCVGAALDLPSGRASLRPILGASAIKFGIMPLLTGIACIGLDLSGPAAATALLFQALPTASSSYILARQLGGDAPLMAAITAAQTLIAAVSIPVVMSLGFVILAA